MAAGCFNGVFITCGNNLMISAHCTNAAPKPDTLYNVLWKINKENNHESPLTGKKPQTNKPQAELISRVSLSTGGETEVRHLI